MADLAGMGAAALNLTLMIISIVVVSATSAGLLWAYLRWKRYSQFKVVIWEKDGFGQFSEQYDKAGVFIHKKTKAKRLWLKKAKVGLTPDQIPYIQTGKTKVVYLIKVGSKNFRFFKPVLNTKQIGISVGEEDVNWATHDFQVDKHQFSDNPLLQYMPFITIGFVTVIILIIFVYFFKNFDVLKDVAIAFQEAAKQLALASSQGTVII